MTRQERAKSFTMEPNQWQNKVQSKQTDAIVLPEAQTVGLKPRNMCGIVLVGCLKPSTNYRRTPAEPNPPVAHGVASESRGMRQHAAQRPTPDAPTPVFRGQTKPPSPVEPPCGPPPAAASRAGFRAPPSPIPRAHRLMSFPALFVALRPFEFFGQTISRA